LKKTGSPLKDGEAACPSQEMEQRKGDEKTGELKF
jgi:hypothetical protein